MAPLIIKQIICVFLGAGVAFLSTNIGGGALLMIPAVILLGLPPQEAVATMRFSGMGGMASSVFRFHRAGKVQYRLGFLISALAVIGTIVGALLLTRIDAALLCRLIAVGNLAVLALILWRRSGVESQSVSPLRWLSLPFFSLAGLVGTLVGGTSIYVTFLLVSCFGCTYSEAAGTRKIVGLASAAVALVLFSRAGLVNFSLGLPLLLGTTLGGHFGAIYGLRRGDRWLGRAFTLMVLLASLRLFFR